MLVNLLLNCHKQLNNVIVKVAKALTFMEFVNPALLISVVNAISQLLLALFVNIPLFQIVMEPNVFALLEKHQINKVVVLNA